MNFKLGTRNGFEEFMQNQAALYDLMTRRHFNLPEAESYKRDFVESKSIPSSILRAAETFDPKKHVETEVTTIVFNKMRYKIGDRDIWIWGTE